jgi:pilus assembly protein Flp/PilA
MRNAFLNLYVKAKVMVDTLKNENGQDLVEYAAVIALVVLAATAGMQTLANGINAAMGSLSTQINTRIG